MKLDALLCDDLIKKHDLFRLFIRFVTPVSAKWFVGLGNWLKTLSLSVALVPASAKWITPIFTRRDEKCPTLSFKHRRDGQLQRSTVRT